MIAEIDQVEKIFVDNAIKKSLCHYAHKSKSSLQFLRKLRPQKYHKTHFHIRLKCSADNRTCYRDTRRHPIGCSSMKKKVYKLSHHRNSVLDQKGPKSVQKAPPVPQRSFKLTGLER